MGESLAKLPGCEATSLSGDSLLWVLETIAAAFESKKKFEVQTTYTDANIRHKALLSKPKTFLKISVTS